MVQGEGTVVDSEVGKIFFTPFIEGDAIVEAAVQRKMRPPPLLAKKRPRRSDAEMTTVAAAEEEGNEEEGEETTYCGVRKRFGNKYVVEIHNSILKDQVWLGTYDKAEMGAWVYGTAARVLRGSMAETNFPRPAAAPELTEEMRAMLAYFDAARRRRHQHGTAEESASEDADPLLMLPAAPVISDAVAVEAATVAVPSATLTPDSAAASVTKPIPVAYVFDELLSSLFPSGLPYATQSQVAPVLPSPPRSADNYLYALIPPGFSHPYVEEPVLAPVQPPPSPPVASQSSFQSDIPPGGVPTNYAVHEAPDFDPDTLFSDDEEELV
uniref:AP2/ERF domain-containing protein n=1 Tax=Leersia perrieri TaxID=77586 RepID=A0A0D9WSD7_9ORYZ